VTFIHDLTPILFPELHRWQSQFLQNIFLRGILRRTDLIIANSDNTARDIIANYPESASKVHRIYPGRNENFHFSKDAGVLVKHGLSKPYFLFVGTIEPRKNLLVLLEAFRLFKERKSADVQLVIVGGVGWKSKEFFAALEHHPFKADIVRPGFVQTIDLPVIYSSAIAFVYPSKYEGFGLPILEAASCGTPIITANNSSLAEAGGPGALYCRSGDSVALASRLEALHADQDLRDDLSSKCLVHAEQFTWDRFAEEILALLSEQQ